MPIPFKGTTVSDRVFTKRGDFMVFSSTLFIFLFLPITLGGYYLIKSEYRNYWLLLVSLGFFAWQQPNYLWLILINIIVNYIGALYVNKFKKGRIIALVLTIAINLGLLFYFKYFSFTMDSINKVLKSDITLKNIVLPIGISFFTFQGMSYVVDVYRKNVPAQRNIFKVALYIALFPQLIAGPIVRYKDIAFEVDNRQTSLVDFSSGIERFIIGLGKKAILANTMASTADAIWNNGAMNNTWLIAWVGSIAYTLQIYFDFSGYSDMAVGLGRMFGFHFNENFKLPYISDSISEFWRRWHISLSSWFKDYVYIPLGGNRKRVYLNLTIVFLLTGIWHGASWHFLAWGVWNGFFIILERFIRNRKEKWTEKSLSIKMISKIYTLFVINLGWVLFRAPHTKDAVQFIGTMFGIIVPEKIGYTVFWYLDKWSITIMLFAIFFASSLPIRLCEVAQRRMPEKMVVVFKYSALLVLLWFSMLRIVAGTYNPFIYFQF